MGIIAAGGILTNRFLKKKLEKMNEAAKAEVEEKADGGRIGLKGGTILNFLKNMGKTMNEKSPAQAYKDYLKSVKDRAQKGDMKTLAPEMGIIAAGGILTNRFLKKKLEKMNEAAKAEVEEKADGGRIGLMAGSIPKVLKLLKNKKRVQQAVDDIFPTGDYKYDAQMAADALVENNPKIFNNKLYEDLDQDTQMEIYSTVLRPITNKMATQMQLQRATRPEKTLASMNEGKGIDMSDPEIADEFGRFMKETDPKGYKELEQKVELSNFKTKDRKGNADGGIMRSAYAGGGMGRRGFLKLLGSLGAGAAAIKTGILGLGGKGAGKQVAKEVVQSAGSGTPPPYFFKLAEKIKKFGDDVTPKYSTQERQVVKQYKDYELTEDMGTGKIEISKKNFPEGDEAVDYFGEPLMEDVYMSYKPGEMVEGAGGKVLKSADEYIEDTAYVRSSGPQTGNISSEMDGIAEETFKKIIKDIDEAPSIKIKKASGGIARMLGE
jgi:hypothetical protein